ncbi:MAG TPA: methyltransferase domain-containing protein [Solirubrobacteraceae bacterium]|nr:methyltransferase domain-containing protein [Solirubrobacteraceae bacterium]
MRLFPRGRPPPGRGKTRENTRVVHGCEEVWCGSTVGRVNRSHRGAHMHIVPSPTSTACPARRRGHLRLVGGQEHPSPTPARPAGAHDAATDYARFYAPITSRLMDPLLDAAHVGDGTRVLDVATGAGCLTARAAQRGACAVGVDLDAAMVGLARRRHPGLEFRQADVEALPFADGTFDAVVGNFLVHHLRSPTKAIAELVRVLAPGGILALSAWDLPSRTRLVGVFLEAIDDCDTSDPQVAPARAGFFHYSADPALAGLLSEVGLDHVAVATRAFDHPVASTEELWTGLFAGTDTTSATRISRQRPEVQRRIRASFERRANEYWTGERLELPVSAKVACGRRLAA